MPTELDKMTVKVNKICRRFEFTKYFCGKFSFCPSGLTLDLENAENGLFRVRLMIKHYGYEGNTTGLDEYDDLSDYEIDYRYTLTGEHLDHVLEYFRENYPEIYSRFDLSEKESPWAEDERRRNLITGD